MNVSRIGSSTLETPDVERLVAHYERVLGLIEVAREDGVVHLGTGRDLPCLKVRRGTRAHLARISLVLAPGSSAEEVARELAGHGVAARIGSDPEPGVVHAIDFDDTEGNGLRLAIAPDPALSPDAPARGNGIAPHKLGHVARRVSEPRAMETFFGEVLGFRTSDWIGDLALFMRCNADHHAMNFFRSAQAPGTSHHIAYELRDLAHLGDACDLLRREGIPVVWGPGRHGAGHNLFVYYQDPDGHLIELFAELDTMLDEALGYFDPRPWHVDVPQRPKVWDLEEPANRWGPPSPAWIRR